MRRAVLERMTSDELAQLAEVSSVDISGFAGDREKVVDALLEDANRTYQVEVAGLKLKVSAATLRDARLVELDAKPDKGLPELREMAVCIVGEGQEAKLAEAATDGGRLDAVLYSALVMMLFKAVQAKN